MERILNVAVATDTILYAPFYTAWFGGDFDKTPFKNVIVNVIGREKGSFFQDDIFKTLKAVDGFVTLCLVFGYADVGICDPSFIIQACETENDSLLKTVFDEFYLALSETEQESFKESHPTLFSGETVVVAELKKEIRSQKVKIIGGLISKIAFTLIGNQELKGETKDEAVPFVGRTHFGDNLRDFAKAKIKNVIYFPEPSTGFCVGSILRNAFSEMPNPKKIEYGKEIDRILNLESTESKNTLALTCDFVSVDFIISNGIDVIEKDSKGIAVIEKDKPKIKKAKQTIFEVEDWVKASREHSAMFTGILAVNPQEEKKELIQAFLYSVDKNLYEINKNIDKGKTALSNYFKSKLDTSHPKLTDEILLKLLIAYPEIEGKCSIEELIYFYVNRLTKWKKEESPLYYDSVTPNLPHLKEIYKIRLQGYSDTPKLSDEKYDSFIDSTLLNSWEHDEEQIKKYKENKFKGFWWKTFTDENRVLNFAAAFITLEIIALIVKLTNYHIVEFDTNNSLSFSIWKFSIDIPINLLAVAVFVGLIYLTYRVVKWGKHLNHLKEKEEFIFRK